MSVTTVAAGEDVRLEITKRELGACDPSSLFVE